MKWCSKDEYWDEVYLKILSLDSNLNKLRLVDFDLNDAFLEVRDKLEEGLLIKGDSFLTEDNQKILLFGMREE